MQVSVQEVIGGWQVIWWEPLGRKVEYCSAWETVEATLRVIYGINRRSQ